MLHIVNVNYNSVICQDYVRCCISLLAQSACSSEKAGNLTFQPLWVFFGFFFHNPIPLHRTVQWQIEQFFHWQIEQFFHWHCFVDTAVVFKYILGDQMVIN